VVCTANICRSPVAERVLQQRLDDAGHDAVVTSAGVMGGVLEPHVDTIKAAVDALDVDITGHRSRRLTTELIRTDGADLVIAMERTHVREIAVLEPTAWPRTFTLRELARRSLHVPADVSDLPTWVFAAAEGRSTADLLRFEPADDLTDPYGHPYRDHLSMVVEVDQIVSRLVRMLPNPGRSGA
jgi:protein-tyrosine phosphatase